MTRVVEQIQRLQGNDLTVLDHGRERHRQGARRARDPRRLASQRGDVPARTTARRPAATSPTASCSATGAAASPARCPTSRDSCDRRPAARCSSTRSATCRSTSSRSCCGFSSCRRSCRSAKRGRSAWTSASLAATNADLEQRVAEGKFREDLYYRLSVIRIHVPPLRERREEIPHLSTFFLREASERLGKPDIQLSSEALDMFSQYWWPGNVRQLKNEIQRAVAMSAPGGTIEPRISRRRSARRACRGRRPRHGGRSARPPTSPPPSNRSNAT